MALIDKDQIRAEIERRIDTCYRADGRIAPPRTRNAIVADEFRDLLSFLDSLQQEQPVEGLEEAANNYCVDIRIGYPRAMDETDKYIYNAFKAGAEWQKKQDDLETADLLAIAHLQGMEQQKSKMLEEAVEGEISVKFPVVGRSLISVIDMLNDFKYGDKVKVIVIPNTDKK